MPFFSMMTIFSKDKSQNNYNNVTVFLENIKRIVLNSSSEISHDLVPQRVEFLARTVNLFCRLENKFWSQKRQKFSTQHVGKMFFNHLLLSLTFFPNFAIAVPPEN
jgi:hypothetical protein